jgi:hypothetical protein
MIARLLAAHIARGEPLPAEYAPDRFEKGREWTATT